MTVIGKTLLTVVALVTSIGCYIADWNVTHIHNPMWPGHAKFHNGQTMSMGLLLGITMLWYLFAPPTIGNPKKLAGGRENAHIWREVQRDAALANLRTVGVLGALYRVTQASAYLYPGSKPWDYIPGVVEEQSYWIQAWLEAGVLSMLALGWSIERSQILRLSK
ncbi:alpha beta-hydrolase [Favolaschia claudopus]|uniref:Alpha beta-hydrolase n=1 Tax=Favolaschia claudopus TaxID=2862362 RepID=A0AAW0CD86_9AGAR